ncbi:MAG: mycofactocin precursor MftA [Actinomycetota bacterium]
MSNPTATAARAADAPAAPAHSIAEQLPGTEPTERADPATEVVSQDLLVEEVSIDGMCGVY